MPEEIDHVLLTGDEAAGLRLDAWLAFRLPSLSRARVQSLIADAHVLVDGGTARASSRLRPGQTVRVRVPAPVAAVPEAEDIPITVVHDDPDFVVIDKPAGLVVHPGAGRASGTLVNALLRHVSGLSGIGGVLRPGIVHRLDRGTSGLLVVAKNDQAHHALARQFASRAVEKHYLALVHGTPAVSGEISAPIGRDPVHRKRMSVRAPRGREARTSWTRERALDGASLLRVRIHTGRTHQIRVHLSSIGHPIVGDATYGGTRTPSSRDRRARDLVGSARRPMLHAARLAFDHPLTGERLAFDAPLPEEMRNLVDELDRSTRR